MRLSVFGILLLAQISLSSAQVSLEHMALPYGKYQVGFHHYTRVDPSRTYNRMYDWTNETISRPIPVSIWYPSLDNVTHIEALTTGDYLVILKEEEEWEGLPNEQILNWFYYPNTLSNQQHLTERSIARLTIKPAKGKFPVIVYAPSYQASSIENFALCEYLASHGYFVIASPSRGTETRLLEGGTHKDIETQTRDLEFLLTELTKYPTADTDHIAAMGFSFGGLACVLAHMRNRNIHGLISLDGSIKYQYKTLAKSPFADMDKVTAPFIHFSQKEIPQQVLREDNIDPSLNSEFEFFDTLRYSEAYHYQFHHLTHSYFSTLGVLFEPRDTRQDKSDREIMESYRWMAAYTLYFLQAYLENDSLAFESINHDPNILINKAGLVSGTTKLPTLKAFTFRDFNDLASKQAYQDLDSLYHALQNQYPGFELPEGNLNNLGLQLVFNSEQTEAGISVFLLALKIFPKSANLWDSLAEGYLYTDDIQKAVLCFEKSLQLNPHNQNAINRLAALRD